MIRAGDYEIQVFPYDANPADSDWGWYWELSRRGVHVNGGLGTGEWDARSRARQYLHFDASRQQNLRDADLNMNGSLGHSDTVDCKGGLLG